ncbi:tetratricopeptide repeat protein [Massilia antarctica]|uniref:tetratricopeptide repeat protein n=1 Tax=Massilia antarctica TaxID=2765360 RepID=UPI00226E83CE|nr:tetratricopeptide repeat protein [Massilia sp. H27-R4]MCY0911073.1 tetratricopeptide repeat protein [Massilia sp. H27-R4]
MRRPALPPLLAMLLALGALAPARARQGDAPATPAATVVTNGVASGAQAVGASAALAAEMPAPAPESAPAEGMRALSDERAAQEEKLYLEALRSLSEGRPDEATSKLSSLLEKNALHAGAWLDLAISHCELGNKVEAERLFDQIEQRFHPSASILELIAHYRASGCKGQRSYRRSMSFKLGAGYDSNVNQGSSSSTVLLGSVNKLETYTLGPDSLPRADHFKVLSGDFNQPIGSRGMLLIAQLRALRYNEVSSQDSESGLLALERPWSGGGWTGRATAAYGLVRLGGELYQRQAQVLLRAVPPLDLGESLGWSLSAGYSSAIYPTRRYYDARTLDLGTSLAMRSKLSTVVLSAGALADAGKAARPGGDRKGWYGGVNLVTLLGEKAIAEVGVSRQSWRGAQIYSKDFIETRRAQDTSQLRASLLFPVGTHSALQLELRRTFNRENIPLFQYDSRWFQFSWRTDNW